MMMQVMRYNALAIAMLSATLVFTADAKCRSNYDCRNSKGTTCCVHPDYPSNHPYNPGCFVAKGYGNQSPCIVPSTTTATTTTTVTPTPTIANVFARMTCATMYNTNLLNTKISTYDEQDSLGLAINDLVGNGASLFFYTPAAGPDPLYSKDCKKDVVTLNKLLAGFGFDFYCSNCKIRAACEVLLTDCPTQLPNAGAPPTTTTVATTATTTTVTTTTTIITTTTTSTTTVTTATATTTTVTTVTTVATTATTSTATTTTTVTTVATTATTSTATTTTTVTTVATTATTSTVTTATTSTATTTTTTRTVTATATTTTTTTVNYCRPAERGQAPQTDCVPIPGLLPNAVINTDYSFGSSPIAIPQAHNNHNSDGTFGAGEWDHVTPAIGRFTNAYIDYADGFLYILNDWIYNPTTPVSDNCYNLFTAFTGSGQQTWSIRVYGSGLVEVELNGELLSQDKTNATGAIGFETSPKQPTQKHTIFELAFSALPGNFGVQLHDPGPRFACSVLETEIVNFVGNVKSSGGGSVETVDLVEFTRRSLLSPTTTSTKSPAVTAATATLTLASTTVTEPVTTTTSLTTVKSTTDKTTGKSTTTTTTNTKPSYSGAVTRTSATSTKPAASTTQTSGSTPSTTSTRSSIAELFDNMPTKTEAFQDNFEPCLKRLCQAETLTCFEDEACIASLELMASQTTAFTGGDWVAMSENPPTNPTPPPTMTAKQEWALGLESLMRSYDAASSQHALVKCMLVSECGVPHQNSGSTNNLNPEAPTVTTKSIWTWLWIIILVVVLAFVVLIMWCCIQRKNARGENAHLSNPNLLVIQNSAYEIDPAAEKGLPLFTAVDNMPANVKNGVNIHAGATAGSTKSDDGKENAMVDDSQC